MANVYDQFDRPGGGNVYDQFDESPAGAKPSAADYLKGAASGVGGLVSGIGYLAERAGADRIGGDLRLAGDTAQKAFLESMTPAGQRAAQSQVFEDDPGSALPKLGDRWGQALAMGAAQSAPSMVAAAIPGGIAAAGLRSAAGMAAARGIGGALAPLAAGTAAPVGGWGANLAGNVAARVPTAIGFGAAEGAVAGASNAAQWKSDIEQKPLAELRNMPGFAALEAQIGEQAARQQIAEQGAADIMARTALATGGIGALTGGGALGSAFQRVTTGAKGGILGAIGRDAAKEAGQEIPQSGGERAIQNIATRDYLDPSQSITQGVLADALSGGAIGGVMGGVTGGGSHLAKGPLQKAAEASAATTPSGTTQGAPTPADGAAHPTTDGSNAGVPPARADASVREVVQAAEAELAADQSPSTAPQQPNTPAAPGISTAPVSTAAPSLPTNQADPAGVPQPPQQGASPSGPQAEIAQPAAPGRQAQPAAVSGAAGTVGNTGTPNGIPAPNTGTQPAPEPTGQDVNLQNRDRSRAASVIQMSEIARNPDYMRLGPSRTPDSGAPMVFAVGDDLSRIPATSFGNGDVAVMSDGQRVPFRYAVVDASQVEPSNFADGRVNPAFAAGQTGTIKALNNGRTAGLRAAYELGSAGTYQTELAKDLANVGISPGALQATPNPILVRVYSDTANTAGMAAKSQAQGLGMSPAELARQDAPLLDSSVLELFRPGDVAAADNRDFVRAFVGRLQQSGQDIAGMMTDAGTLSPMGRQRIQAALMQAAYGDADLVAELFDSIDTDIKAIGEALKAVAGAWANMRDSARVGHIALEADITPHLMAAVRLIQQARRDRVALYDLANQRDIETGEPPSDLTLEALRLFYTGHYLTRPVAKETLTGNLERYLELAMATSPGADMFGEKAEAEKLLQAVTKKEAPDEEGKGREQQPAAATPGAGAGGGRPKAQRQRGAGGGDSPASSGGAGGAKSKGDQDAVIVPPSAPAAEAKPKPAPAAKQETPPADRPDLTLRGQTPAEVAAAEAEAKAAADKEAKARQDAEKARKDAEDRAEIKRRSETAAESFELGGDAMANLSGQGDMFAGPPAAAAPSREPTSKTGELPPEANAASDDLGALFDNELEAAFPKPEEEGNEPGSVGNSQRDREAADAQRGDEGALSDERGREGATPGGGVSVPDADRRGGRPGGPGVSGVGAASGGERGDQPVPGTKRPAGVEKLPAGDNQRQGSADVRPGGVAASGGESAAAVGGPAGGGVGPRSAPEAGKSAAKNAGLALSDVARGLNALFKPKPGRLGVGLPFDEDTYAAAKPYFQAGLAHVRQAGADIVDMMRALIAALRDQFGMDKDTIAAMKPYVLRYISDVQAGREAIEETSPQQPPKDKLQQQQAAESIKVIVGDKANIDATLPFLTEGQREDVLFAEQRWAASDGYGVLFTNGTGTGKTFLALGAIKRLTKRGKGNGIVVVPNEAVMNEWVKSAPALGLQVKPLTDTKDAGSGIAITTYANFGQNDEIAKRDYDFVAIDEAHLLMLGKDAEPTKALDALRAVSLHPDGVLQRAEMQNRELVDRIRATSDQLTSLYRMMNNPDIMDQMYAAYRAEADGLERKLAADRAKWEAALEAVESDVMARQGEKRTRAIFLSATPFAYEPSIQWGEGYLYEFPQVSGRGYNEPSGYQKFMMQHFGWRMRNGKLTQPPAEVDSDLMQRQFNTWLRKEGVLSARMLDVDHDYERKFILIQGGVGQTIDDGLRWLRETDNGRYWSLYHAINEQFDYLTRSRLLEAIKARAAIPYIKKHHALGRKVVVFYDFNSGGGINVFNLSEQLQRAEAVERMPGYAVDKDGVDVPVRGQGKAAYGQIKTEKAQRSQLIREFMAARPELQAIDFSQYGSPLTTLLEAFPGAGVYNGMSQYKKTRVQSIRDFNDDAKPEANLLLVQKAANAGWSGHDTTGKHARVLINLGLPVAPIEAIQEEGRIYRVGQKSDANFQYFNTGTNWERYAFGSKIARRAGTAENLAMGEQARGLREAFIQAFENSDPDYEPGAADGKGGKTGDRDLVGAITEWDRARSLYFAQQKRTSRTKAAEGVDYYATPEPLGLKMVEWAGILPGERVLEPSAGHGAIARWFPEKNDRTVIEPSLELASRLTLATDAKLVNERFEDHDTINKYDAIVMNPPFGAGGKTAIEHLDKAFRHLADGGRLVALIPEGPAANKRFDDWLYGDKQVRAKPVANDVGAFGAVFLGDTATVEVSGMAGIAGGVMGTGTITGKVTGFREGKLFVKREGEAWATGYRADQIRAVQPTGARTTTVKSAPDAYLRVSIGLPGVTFERAGTGVKTRVVIIDKIEGVRASRAVETQPTREIEAATVKELFDRLENMEVVGRSLPAHKEQEKKQGQERSAAKAATAGKADDVGLVQPDGSPATIEQLQKPEKAGGPWKLLTDAPRVPHVTAKTRKTIFGVVSRKLTRDEARSVDPYSWPKDGGFFIRMEHVVRPANVAEQERAVYNVNEPDGITGDLFRGATPDLFSGTDHALPAAARTNLPGERAAPARVVRPAPGPAARVLAVRQAQDAPGLYHVSTQLVTVGERELPVERIRTTEDAAKAFAYLPRWAVEHYDAIVTDKDGKPLAIIGGFKGGTTQTSVSPATVVAELSRIDGAKNLWTAHNHPSGLAVLSNADRNLDREFATILEGTGVNYHGLFAVVGARAGVVKYDHTIVGAGQARQSRKGLLRIPMVERELTDRREDVDRIDGPESAKDLVAKIAGETPGIVFLDAQNGIVAFAPFRGDEMGSLRRDGRLMRLFRSASQANAVSAIVANPNGEIQPDQIANLVNALGNIEVSTHDVIGYSTTEPSSAITSMSKAGSMPSRGIGSKVVFSAASTVVAASPSDRAIFDLAQDGKPAGEILSFITKSSRSPFNRVLAAALRRVGVSSTVALDDTGGWRFGNRSYAQRYAAAYNPTTDTVALFTPHEAERHVLHELVHAATLKAIAAGGPAAVRMRALFRHVQKSGRLDGQYGMTDVDEFVAEAFSNPRFQEALRGLPAPAGSTLKSAWQWFVRIVARIVGIRTQPSETALDRALTVGAQLMRENVALRDVATGKVPGAKNAKELLPSVLLNARNDAGVKPIVVDAPRDVNRGDIRFNIAGTQPAVTPPASSGNLWQAAKARAAALLTPGRIDKLIYEFQDKFIDLRRTRDHIREIGGTISDLNDAYLGEELYHKRLAHRTEDFLKAELRPLLADMKARGVGMDELESFLHARHAPEANAEMAKRNPNQAEIDAGRKNAAAVVRGLERNLQTAQARGMATKAVEQALNDARGELVKWNGAQAFNGTEQERRSLSGMTDQAAAAIMAGLSPQRRADLDALAARMDDINAGTLQLLEDYGLMSKESLETWRRTYQFYVPLHRDEAHPDSANHPVGQGFSVKGEAAKRRTGSNQKVTHILGHIAMQREAALTRGEKNRVMLKLYLMARQNPLPDVWKVGAVPMKRSIDEATGFVHTYPDPLYKTLPNVVTLRIAGKDVAITMNEHNPQALRMAQALKNLDVDDLHYIIPIVGRVTRWFAAVNTQYNPIFGIINLMRDIQGAALNLSTTELAGKQGQIFKDQLSILGGVLKNKGRMPTTGTWAALFEEFNAAGGTTGYRDLYLHAEDRAKKLLDELKALDRGQTSKAAYAVLDWLSDYNEAMENATRLAAYKAALDQGLSRERAASLAKNLTVNFNRKGRQTRELGALYAFLNASIQGTTRMAQTLAGPAGRKIMAGGVALGALSAMLGIAMMGDEDDDEWAKIPEYIKERAIIIPVGKQDYIAIPMPLGFHFLPNIGRLAVEMAVYKNKTAGRQMASLATVLADAFNPLGGSAPAAQIVAPTVLDPVVALLQNKDWTGKPIYVENFSTLNPEPGFKRTKDSATPWAKGFAEAINAITGGTQYVPGGWSPTPDQIDYVIGQLTGGIGREAGKVAATVAAPFSGEELPPYKIPLVGRLYGSTGGTSGQSEAFYERIRQANAAESEIKGRLKDGGGIAAYLQEHPHAVELAALGNAAERQVRELRGIRRGIVSRGEPDAVSRAREVNERMAAVMRGFNRQAERIQ
mgnify:FL=1